MTKKETTKEERDPKGFQNKIDIPASEEHATKITPRSVYIKTKMKQQTPAKIVIAKHIAEKYVKDFDAVLLDAGSTAELIAEELFIQRKYLSVMTNNMGAFASYTRAIAPPEKGDSPSSTASGYLNENELLLPGGRYDATYEALFGDATIDAMQKFTPNVTIIGVSGLIFNEGVFCHGSEEVRIKRLIWTQPTDIRVIAADCTKIGKRDAYAFVPRVDELSIGARKAVVVTNNPLRSTPSSERKEFDEQVKKIKDAGIIVDILNVPE